MNIKERTEEGNKQKLGLAQNPVKRRQEVVQLKTDEI